jgi:hypothetical protein
MALACAGESAIPSRSDDGAVEQAATVQSRSSRGRVDIGGGGERELGAIAGG